MSEVIQVERLQKRYGKQAVLKGVSFSVQRGEIFALLGTNGAGKTTTLECVEGLRPCDGGSISVRAKRACSSNPPACRSTSGQWKRSDCLRAGKRLQWMEQCSGCLA